jgi:hypothetical protein
MWLVFALRRLRSANTSTWFVWQRPCGNANGSPAALFRSVRRGNFLVRVSLVRVSLVRVSLVRVSLVRVSLVRVSLVRVSLARAQR